MTWPPTPDVEAAVLARIDPRRPRRRLVAAIAAAALLVPAGGAAAWRVVDGLVVEDGPPPMDVLAPPERRPLAIRAAERTAGFAAFLPPALGEPGRVTAEPGLIVLDYGDVSLSQLRGTLVRKFARGTREVPGGAFIRGKHFYLYERNGVVTEGTTVASTLIVERGGLLLRLSGDGLTYARARALLEP